ncbi:MAG: response regulator transcription factor [Ruminococcus sp.]|nr:response regulator transcription factor [Ruminococcus sp.]MBP8594716.1 response regulator transcription factor [Ruminococcus sp.]MBQ8122011.1 response regulator transcription factor [Ruminococcus sp.]HBB18885.1 DNA-binding response regulator [Ruminococcus sp.]HOO06522.1 response regulator transcription factor [Ruminococcus sp.]
MRYQCLMIDDDATIAETTAEYFNMFDITTASVGSYEEAERFLEENQVSLLLLDINLGDRSGFELCKQIRRKYDMPILFISARTSDDDILTALNIGGDDYIKKPYTMSILLAKVRAVLARYEKAAEAAREASQKQTAGAAVPDQILLGNGVSLNTGTHLIIRDGKSISLKAMEYKMLLYLLENRGRVVTKEEFLSKVWQDTFVGEGTLPVHIRHLREKIEQDPNDPKIIRTVWGVGYIIGSDEE